MKTKREELQELETQGVTGAAAELLAGLNAAARHKWRVERAIEAALTWVVGETLDFGAFMEALRGAQASALMVKCWWVLTLEVGGIGGVGGYEGSGTARHPAFRRCGKGRKQANDGNAWDAAILEARNWIGGVIGEIKMEGHLGCREEPCLKFTMASGETDIDVVFLEELAWWRADAARRLIAAQGRPEELKKAAGWFNLLATFQSDMDAIAPWVKALPCFGGLRADEMKAYSRHPEPVAGSWRARVFAKGPCAEAATAMGDFLYATPGEILLAQHEKTRKNWLDWLKEHEIELELEAP